MFQVNTTNITNNSLDLLRGPRITSVSLPSGVVGLDSTGGQTITVTGSGFLAGCTVFVGTTQSSVVTIASTTQLSFITPPLSTGLYLLYIYSSDGVVATYVPGLLYSNVPTWSTTAGSLGTFNEFDTFNISLAATSDSSITYTVTNGVLPPGAYLNPATGTITGSAQSVTANITYSFTVTATDRELQTTARDFSISVRYDAVTWVNPTGSGIINILINSPYTLTLSASSTLSEAIIYSAYPLPAGLTRSNNVISGTPTTLSYTVSNISAGILNKPNSNVLTIVWNVISVNAPTIGTASRTASQTVQVTYTAPSNPGNYPIVSYTAVSNPGGITGTLVQAGSGTITVNGLTNGTAYTFTIYSTNTQGSNSLPSGISNTATPYTVPDIPTGLTAATVNNNWPQLSFTPGFNGGSAVTQYTVTSTPGGLTGTGTGSPISIPGLTGNTFYTFSIYATNIAGNSTVAGPSNQIYFVPYVVVATAPVISGTVASNSTLTSSTGTWTGYGTTVTSYAYQWNRGGTPISGATSSTYKLSDTEISFTITCTVTATAASPAASGSSTSAGVGPFYAPLLAVNQNADSTLNVSWSNFTGGSPTTYQVLVDGALQTTVTAPATSVSSLSVSSGANRVLTINAYNGASLMSGITKNFRRFDYTGGAQTWTAPVGAPGYILADVLGAQGGESGGQGGRTRAYIAVNNSETINLYVGGKGTDGTGSTGCVGDQPGRAGGFNGGGNGGANKAGCAGGYNQRMGSGGGGASDIRRNGTALSNRIIVSGGGGGCGPASGFVNSSCGGTAADVGQGAGYNTGAGSGGVNGQIGCGGGWPISSAGGGASTSSGGSAGTGDETVGNVGSLGQGANGNFSFEGSNNPGRSSGGGGGYYGGGSGGINSNYGSGGSGGGGSGYLDPGLTTIYSSYGTATSGYNTGDGKILLSW